MQPRKESTSRTASLQVARRPSRRSSGSTGQHLPTLEGLSLEERREMQSDLWYFFGMR